MLAIHPLFPIYVPLTNRTTDAFQRACHRMFHILDRDGDGLLSHDEMALHQEYTFGVRVTHAEMDGVFAVRCGATVLVPVPPHPIHFPPPACPHTHRAWRRPPSFRTARTCWWTPPLATSRTPASSRRL